MRWDSGRTRLFIFLLYLERAVFCFVSFSSPSQPPRVVRRSGAEREERDTGATGTRLGISREAKQTARGGAGSLFISFSDASLLRVRALMTTSFLRFRKRVLSNKRHEVPLRASFTPLPSLPQTPHLPLPGFLPLPWLPPFQKKFLIPLYRCLKGVLRFSEAFCYSRPRSRSLQITPT